MNVRSTLLQEILEGAEQLNLPGPAREQFKRLVRQVGIAHGVAGMAHAEHVHFARRLIDAGVSRATIRDRLMALHGVSRRQAYVVIDAAINCADSLHFSAHVSATLKT